MKKYPWIGLAILLLAPFIPVSQLRILSKGVDSYSTHRVIFSDHTVGQEVTLQGKLTGVSAIIVDYYRKEQLVDVHVAVQHPNTDKTITTTVIPKEQIQDDHFATTDLETPVGGLGERIHIELSAPQTDSGAPLAVRYDPNTTYENSSRFEDNDTAAGTYAVGVHERVPLWRYVITNIHNHKDRWAIGTSALAISLLLALLSLQVGWRAHPAHIKRAIQLGIIVSIAALSLNFRLQTIENLGGVSGGDPYNYLFITQSITELKNPFDGVKRLPGYPIILIPSYLSPDIDDQIYMETVSAISAAGSLIILFLLARALGLPWPIGLLASSIIALQKDFFWTSIRPEPYSFFTLLFLTTVLLFFRAKTWKGYLGFGIALGYAAMTRQEGFVVALILGIAALGHALWQIKKQEASASKITKKLSLMFLPALALVTPFFIHNTLEYGNPIFTPYFEGERLQIVDSWPAFKDSAEATWGVLGSMWKPAWDSLERYARSDTWFIGFVAGTILYGIALHYLMRRKELSILIGISTAGIAILVTFIWVTMIEKPMFSSLFPHAVSAIMFISATPFLYYTRWKGALVTILLLSQILIPTWFHPFAKHYQQSYPLIALFIATALFAPLYVIKSTKAYTRIAQGVLTTALLFPFVITPIFMFEHDRFHAAIDDHNAATALDSVVFRAISFVRTLDGKIGFDEAHLPARLYYSDKAAYFAAIQEPTKQEEQEWLTTNAPDYIVSTNANKIFHEVPSSWEEIANFKSAGKGEKIFESWVYRLP